MYRYCKSCKKEFDFTIKSVTDLDNLICPECGQKIDKNSRKTDEIRATGEYEVAENMISGGLSCLYTIRYYFFLVLSVIGIVAFFGENYKLMVAMTIANVVIYVIGIFLTRRFSIWGLGFIAAGGFLGYQFMVADINGICFGILCAFTVRHIMKAFLFRLLFGLLNKLTR